MDERTLALIRRLFKKYYLNAEVHEPKEIAMREFAFVYFKSKGMARHISFSELGELKKHLVLKAPMHAYYSSSYYRNPAAENMNEKEWLGADLIFDIDVDHINTPCKPLHDSWVCKECGSTGWGYVVKCPKCGSERVSRTTWVCETCINVARDELLKLIDFLERDFGFSHKDMYAVFSGHRGFHLHVESDDVIDLDQDARREIADYVRGVGIEPELFLRKVKRRFVFKYDVLTPGWPGRIARYILYKFLRDTDDVRSISLSLKRWKDVIEDAVNSERVFIDEKVTIDTKRLIRLPGSLHGKTGLKVLKLDLSEVEGVDVLEKAKVFRDGNVVLSIDKPPRQVLDYKLGDKVDKENLEVPLYLGIYMILNGGAKLKKFI